MKTLPPLALNFFAFVLLLQLSADLVLSQSPVDIAAIIQRAELAVKQAEPAKAKELFQQALTASEASVDPKERWWALMSMAWFQHQTGDYKHAIEHSNKALEIGAKANNKFLTGRALCWLGWAYAAMGRYEAAQKFYEQAAELGQVNGEISIVPVWGLATQELGATYYKLGDAVSARQLLTRTLDYARENEIDVGISEGGVSLGEISLAQGNFSEAEKLADEAVKASYDCACSPFNTARALLFKAKVLLKHSETDLSKKEMATAQLAKTLDFASSHQIAPIIAESKILLSKSLPKEQFTERKQLLDEALKIVENLELESSPMTNAAVGSLFLESQSLELAEFYIKQGLKLSAEMLKTVDEAYIQSEQAALSSVKGDQATALKELAAATDKALSSGSLVLATENQIKLSNAYLELGYDLLSLKQAELALVNITKLINKDAPKTIQENWKFQSLLMQERKASLSLRLGNLGNKLKP